MCAIILSNCKRFLSLGGNLKKETFVIIKKIFFPVGGGEELDERIFGALTVAKYFNTHLEILLSQAVIKDAIPHGLGVEQDLVRQIEEIHKIKLEKELETHKTIFAKYCAKHDIKISNTPIDKDTTAHLSMGAGKRSELVAQQSKFCDLVVAATPPDGVVTATFEASVVESGKPVLVIPRKMSEFKADNILVGWNNSPQSARAITESIPLLQEAKKVHIISSAKYTTDTLSRVKDLQNYLKIHGIETTFELIKTTFVPGEASLKIAQEGKFDLLVVGAYGKKRLKDMMRGGSAQYLLKHTTIPVFMAH